MINVPNSIKVGFCSIMFCHTRHITVKFNLIDVRTNKIIDKNPNEIKNGERAVVLLEIDNNYKLWKKFLSLKNIERTHFLEALLSMIIIK